MQTMDLNTLNLFYQTHKADFPDPFKLRMHRALSWLNKAQTEREGNDLDIQFIALWIAFNAAYAQDLNHHSMSPERSRLRGFLQTVCRLDQHQYLANLVWQRFSGSIRLLLDNAFVFQPFWDFHNGLLDEAAWQQAFAHSKRKAKTALANQDTEEVLAVVFDRLYTLRNQIVHGGATFRSSANRQQLKDGCAFLSEAVLAVTAVMLEHPHHDQWGKPFYPFIRENG